MHPGRAWTITSLLTFNALEITPQYTSAVQDREYTNTRKIKYLQKLLRYKQSFENFAKMLKTFLTKSLTASIN